jgi:hypothetical protein
MAEVLSEAETERLKAIVMMEFDSIATVGHEQFTGHLQAAM